MLAGNVFVCVVALATVVWTGLIGAVVVVSAVVVEPPTVDPQRIVVDSWLVAAEPSLVDPLSTSVVAGSTAACVVPADESGNVVDAGKVGFRTHDPVTTEQTAPFVQTPHALPEFPHCEDDCDAKGIQLVFEQHPRLHVPVEHAAGIAAVVPVAVVVVAILVVAVLVVETVVVGAVVEVAIVAWPVWVVPVPLAPLQE